MNTDEKVCPFGEELQKYWEKRYFYFSKFDEGIQIDKEGLYSVIPEEIGARQAALISGNRVFDGFAGVGGSAIAFAKAGKTVISSELDPIRLAMARNNAKVYGVSQTIEFIEGNFFDIGNSVDADTVNLDPPWGGLGYKDNGKFLLSDFNPDGNKILEFCVSRFNEIILRVPTIFDMSEIDRFSQGYEVHDDVSAGRVISKTVIMRKTNPKE